MARLIKNNLGNFLVILLIFLMVAGWIFSGWPQIFNFPPKIQQAWATQYARPNADELTGNWFELPLYAKIDEESYDDGDYVTSGTNPSSDIFEVNLIDVSDPESSSDHTVRYRARTTKQTGLIVRLMQGGGEIANQTPSLTTSFQEFTFTLTSLQADSIDNYADLRLRFEANGARGTKQLVSWAVFEVPDAANQAPTWTVDAYEDPDSTSTNPTNADGSSVVTFKATASDLENEQYYLAICKAEETPTAGDDGPPTCGASGAWVICGPYNDDDPVTGCTYQVQEADAEFKAWYGYICDKHAGGGACNLTYKATNSPFNINRRASFTTVTDLPDASAPGNIVEITTEADDPDSDGGADTLKLFVCKTTGATASGCDGGDTDTWCKDDSGTAETHPTCNWQMNVTKTGNVSANQCEGAYSYWAYIFDNHGFAASTTGEKQGFEFTNTVDNVAPEVTAVSLNGGSDFTPDNEEASKDITVIGTVKDDNGCVDVDDATTADTSIYYYKAATKGYVDCDDSPVAEDDNNYCYSVRDCVYNADSCTGTTDSDSTFTCTVAIQYHANPTDGASLSDSTWWDYTWRATLIGSDGNLSHTMESTDIEMISVMAYDLNTANINYDGPLDPGATSADQTTEVEATGNVGLDVNLYSVEEYMYTDWPGKSGYTIPIARQHYHGSDVAWGSMSGTLSQTTSDELELNCPKTTETGTPAVKNVHWKIQIPDPQAVGNYTGENTIAGKKGEAENW